MHAMLSAAQACCSFSIGTIYYRYIYTPSRRDLSLKYRAVGPESRPKQASEAATLYTDALWNSRRPGLKSGSEVRD